MQEYKLKYDEPARVWEEALPLGNGKLGAMVFGRPDTEIVRLNEETLWEGYPYDWDNPNTKEHLPEIQSLIFKGEYGAAFELALKYLKCNDCGSELCHAGEPYGTFRTAGDLVLVYHGENSFVGRRLDMKHGCAVTDTTAYLATHYTSITNNVMVSKIEAKNERITLDIRFDPHVGIGDDFDIALRACSRGAVYESQGILKNTEKTYEGVKVSDKGIFYQEQLSPKEALRWNSAVYIETDGEKTLLKDGIRVRSAERIIIYTAISTSYVNEDPEANVNDAIEKAIKIGEEKLYDEHIAEFESKMTASTLTLESDEALKELPTDKRLRCIAEGKEDIGFAELYFNFGKYLLISSSANGCTLPANLQGIWSKDEAPPWSADYHININLQMNYWPAEVTGLGECADSFFKYIKFLSRHGEKTAKVSYGCRGWTAHTCTTPFGFTALGQYPIWGCFNTAGAWCCTHIFDHYRYTLDRDFLKEYWQVVKGSALFYLDYLVKDPNTGYMVTCPSNSPENSFIDPKDGSAVGMYAGPTMDSEILTDLFSGILEFAEVAGESDSEFLAQVKESLGKLPPLRIGKHGNIMEWLEDYKEADLGHRHISHLYALHPSSQITKTKTPELYEAAKKTIERRLAHGGGHTGWSRAWIANFYARLHDGENAKAQLDALFAKSTLTNLFDSHPPFQIDGNFGGCSAIAEMLVQDTDGVELLPALPKAWKNGSFTGFRVKGNKKVSCKWQNGEIVDYSIE